MRRRRLMILTAIVIIVAIVVWHANQPHPQQPPPTVAWSNVLVSSISYHPSSFLVIGNGGRIYFGECTSGQTRILDPAGKVLSERVIPPAHRELSDVPFLGGDGKLYVELAEDGGNTSVAELLADGSLTRERKIKSLCKGMCGVGVDAAGSFYAAGDTLVLSTQFNIAKYDAGGSLIWTRNPQVSSYGFTGAPVCGGLAVNKAGRAFVLGSAESPNGNGFIAQIDSTGKKRWLARIGSGAGIDSYSIAADPNGGACVAGSIWTPYPSDGAGGSIWDRIVCAIGNYRLRRFTRVAGPQDYFLARFDKNGKQIWFREGLTPDEDYAFAIAIDSKGNTFIAGPDCPAGARSSSTVFFAAKYDADGCLMWRTRINTFKDVEVHGISVDNKGGVYICGRFGSPEKCFLVKLQERR